MIFLLIITGVICAPLLIALAMPSSYRIEKSVIIRQKPEYLLGLIGNLGEFERWHPWIQVDKTVQITVEGTPATVGQTLTWKGKKIGKGTLVLTSIDDQHIHFDQQYQQPWSSLAREQWHIEPWGHQETKLSWLKQGSLPWPIARLMGPVISKNLAYQQEKGLNNLKELAEAPANNN